MDPAWLAVVPAYLLGTFPTAILVGRREGRDPTVEGSRNPGASNALRTMGRRAAALVLLGDAGKGALAAGAGWALGGRTVGAACGLAAVLGHVVPVTRRFHGGKGVATLAGMGAVLLPAPMVVLAVAWGAVAKLSGLASVGSLLLAAGLPVGAAVTGRPVGEVAAVAVAGAVVIARHHENIDRLRQGRERSLTE